MKCSINRNLEIESRRKELLMKLARPEEILEKLGFKETDPDKITWEETDTVIRDFFSKRLPTDWMGSRNMTSLSWAGIEKAEYDRLVRSKVFAWVKYQDSPKLGIVIWMGQGQELDWYIPWRGNPINPQTGRPIGWDAGYMFDQSLWAQTYPEDFEHVCRELYGGKVLEDGEETIYDIVHCGILEPDWTALESEFNAYSIYI